MELPISAYKSEIVESCLNNPVTILSAETGSGKSTKVCQYLYEAGYNVIVTEPRRLATISLATRVSEEMSDSEGIVSYRTGFESTENKNTRILFCTDGLQLVREILGNQPRNTFLIIDEIHEWNINMETLLAWVKYQLSVGINYHVVIMSATMDCTALCNYFNGIPAVFEIQGRTYPVKPYWSFHDKLAVIQNCYNAGKNILVFEPGKSEINKVITDLESYLPVNAVVLPLHGDLPYNEQRLCFNSYTTPKVIVATDIAQTSITIPDIDVIVDSGLRKIMRCIDGIDTLCSEPISKADIDQRKGRAGRTHNGEYYLISDTSYEFRPDYTDPEIVRISLEQLVLRLLSAGLDARDLEFYHQPNIEDIEQAFKLLNLLGAISDNSITTVGLEMAKLPLRAIYSRMVIEAISRGVLEDVITIVSILESGSLLFKKEGNYYDFTAESKSDLIAELEVFNKSQFLDYKTLKLYGVNIKTFNRAKEYRNKIIDSLRNSYTIESTGNRTNILRSCLSGLIGNFLFNRHLYIASTNNHVYDVSIDKNSCINLFNCKWDSLIFGVPRTITTEKYGHTNSFTIMTMATIYNLADVLDVAPFLVNKTVDDAVEYDSFEDQCYKTQNTSIYEILIDSERVPVYDQDISDYFHNLYNPKPYRSSSIDSVVVINNHSYHYKYDPNEYISSICISITEDDVFNSKTDVFFAENGSRIGFACNGYHNHSLSILKKSLINSYKTTAILKLEKSLPVFNKVSQLTLDSVIPYSSNTSLDIKGLSKPYDVYFKFIFDEAEDVLTFKLSDEDCSKDNLKIFRQLVSIQLDTLCDLKKSELSYKIPQELISYRDSVLQEFATFKSDMLKEITFDNYKEVMSLVVESLNDYQNEIKNKYWLMAYSQAGMTNVF